MNDPITVRQKSTNDREHVMELITPAVPCGYEGGYITRRAAEYSVFGCTCGEYVEGPTAFVNDKFRDHIKETGVIEHG